MADDRTSEARGGVETPRRRSLFRKGRSGNPKGRPKGTCKPEPASPLDPILELTFSATRDGRTVALTAEEALDQKVLEEALKGNQKAERIVVRMLERWLREKARREPSAEPPHRPLAEAIPVGPAAEACARALIALDIARPDPKALVYEKAEWELDEEVPLDGFAMTAWAVQAALDRPGRLEVSDWRVIKFHALEVDDVEWPFEAGG